MILEIQHETRLDYTEPVTEAVAEMRVEPVSDAEQTCCSFNLNVSPPVQIFHYADGFNNRVHHFNLLPAHTQMRVHAASVVQTQPRECDLSASRAIFPVGLSGNAREIIGFLNYHGPVRLTPLLTPLIDALTPAPDSRLADLIFRVSHYIHAHFRYAKDVTQASSPIDDVLRHGQGVCQDFAHLMIAILRRFGVPARYVSGYLHRPGKESQSHAWCEAWLPDLGWVGIDPTNDRPADESLVKVAIGRDFTDVPPNKGVYRGQARESISVRVQTRALDRLPALSWQEHLPPLAGPLTLVASHSPLPTGIDDTQEQQQQQ
jgi:transglutaminase-like putative cysteine protease